MVEPPLRANWNGENDKVNRSWGLQDDFLASFILRKMEIQIEGEAGMSGPHTCGKGKIRSRSNHM